MMHKRVAISSLFLVVGLFGLIAAFQPRAITEPSVVRTTQITTVYDYKTITLFFVTFEESYTWITVTVQAPKGDDTILIPVPVSVARTITNEEIFADKRFEETIRTSTMMVLRELPDWDYSILYIALAFIAVSCLVLAKKDRS